jgi:hypothetical protein
MAALIGMSRAAWRRQPQGAVDVNESNPLAVNLVFAQNTKAFGYDSKARKLCAVVGAIWGVEGYQSAGTDSSTYIQSSPVLQLGALQNSTVFALSRTDAGVTNVTPGTTELIGGGGNAIYCERGSAGNDIYKLEWIYSGSGELPDTLAAAFVYRNDGGTLLQKRISATGLNNNTLVASAIVKTGTNHAVYVDGRIDSGTFGSSSTAFTDATVESWIGGDKRVTTSFWNGSIPLVAGWSRALLKGELDELRRNPWQLFKPRRARFFLPPSAPGVPTSLLNRNLAATSFRSAWTAPA